MLYTLKKTPLTVFYFFNIKILPKKKKKICV